VAQVEIYSSMFCPFCSRAKHLLTQKGVAFVEIDVDTSPGRRNEMLDRANGQRTVPQIFIDDHHVGGSDDLAALDRAGKLDGMLGLG
jgi:glutaredoxin 3